MGSFLRCARGASLFGNIIYGTFKSLMTRYWYQVFVRLSSSCALALLRSCAPSVERVLPGYIVLVVAQVATISDSVDRPMDVFSGEKVASLFEQFHAVKHKEAPCSFLNGS